VVKPLADNAVKALPVIVDHPPGVAKIMLPAFLQALIDIALVQLRIADKRDHPPLEPVRRPFPGADIVLYDGGESGDGDAKADGPRREIHVIDILGTAGIRLRAAVPPEILQLLSGLIAHQILD